MSRRNRKIYVSESHIVKRNVRREKGREARGMGEKERSREREREREEERGREKKIGTER